MGLYFRSHSLNGIPSSSVAKKPSVSVDMVFNFSSTSLTPHNMNIEPACLSYLAGGLVHVGTEERAKEEEPKAATMSFLLPSSMPCGP